MNISIDSSNTYPTLTSSPGIMYNAFIESLSFERNNAIEAVYHNGYITEDEAKQLKEDGYAKRNALTNIYIADTLDSITLYCLEHEDTNSFSNINTLFKLSYRKDNGILIDELNTDIAN